MIQIEDICKVFELPRRKVTALNNISLQVGKGEFIVVKGPSGSGKTTLLMSIGGMLRPTSGMIKISDENIWVLNDRKRARFRAGNIGFVFQMFYLIPYLNVLENIQLSMGMKNDGADLAKAMKLTDDLGLSHRIKHRPSELSTGECQRVALGRAMIHRPDLILADEPTGNLDKQNAAEVVGILADYKKGGGTIILATHGDDADRFADRIVLLKEGEIEH
jgi:putative ABC transport system ATP-binding protein